MIMFQLEYCLGNVFWSFDPIFIACVSELFPQVDKYSHSCPSRRSWSYLALGQEWIWKLGTRQLRWDCTVQCTIYNVLWNKWSSWCMSEPVRLKYLGKSCAVIGELSCLSFHCSLANLQSFRGLLSLMVLSGGFSVSVLKWLCALLFSPKSMGREMCIVFQICSAISFVHI